MDAFFLLNNFMKDTNQYKFCHHDALDIFYATHLALILYGELKVQVNDGDPSIPFRIYGTGSGTFLDYRTERVAVDHLVTVDRVS